jgi:hypothetical protein
MVTSRDNVNPIAVVIIKAYDRNGDVIDQHDTTGRHEPALQLLDFMTNCQALWGKNRIVRYVCEVVYVLGFIVFLSSIAPLAYAHGVWDASPLSLSSATSDVSGIPHIRYVRVRPVSPRYGKVASPATFAEPHEPIRFVVPWPPVETKPQREGREFLESVQRLEVKAENDVVEYSTSRKVTYFAMGLAGVLTLIFLSGYGHWRRFK